MPPSRARARTTLRRSQVSGVCEAAGDPLYREGRVPGLRVPETQSWLGPGGPCAPPAAGSQRAAPRAGEAAAAPLPAPPYLLYFGLQVHICVSEGFLLLSGI